MRRPTEDEKVAIRAECRKRFGHERLVGVPLAAPVDAYVVFAALDLASASAHMDARLSSGINAASALVDERRVWPPAAEVSAMIGRFGMLELELAAEIRETAGFPKKDGEPSVVRLSVATSPPGLTASAAGDLLAANAGLDLWAITRRENGLSLVIRGPAPEVVQAAGTAAQDAAKARSGAITWALGSVRDHCVWAPGTMVGGAAGVDFDRHIDEMPGRADDLGPALLKIGGAGTARRAEFL